MVGQCLFGMGQPRIQPVYSKNKKKQKEKEELNVLVRLMKCSNSRYLVRLSRKFLCGKSINSTHIFFR